MVELRKRKAAEPALAPAPKKANSVKSKIKAVAGDGKESKNGASIGSSNKVGETITSDSFGGEIETNEGEKTSLTKLLDESKSGLVLFTYPKASTPGCTTQACLFRDEYAQLTATGLSIYGLSSDSPKSNTTFKTKQSLPYKLLCDPSQTLIAAIGMKKAPRGTTRGVFVVDKAGKILAAEAGGPAATVDVVRKLLGPSAVNEDVGNNAEGSKAEKEIEEKGGNAAKIEAPSDVVNGGLKEDSAQANVAADVADTAEMLDAGASA